MYPHDSPKACCYSANDPARCPSPFYYWDVLLFIHHWLLGDAGWQGAEVAPHFPPLSPLSKPPPPPPLLPFFFFFLISAVLLFLLLHIYGRFMWETGESRAGFILFSSDRLVVLASKESGSIDGKVNNAPNGVHVNIIKRCHVQ